MHDGLLPIFVTDGGIEATQDTVGLLLEECMPCKWGSAARLCLCCCEDKPHITIANVAYFLSSGSMTSY